MNQKVIWTPKIRIGIIPWGTIKFSGCGGCSITKLNSFIYCLYKTVRSYGWRFISKLIWFLNCVCENYSPWARSLTYSILRTIFFGMLFLSNIKIMIINLKSAINTRNKRHYNLMNKKIKFYSNNGIISVKYSECYSNLIYFF